MKEISPPILRNTRQTGWRGRKDPDMRERWDGFERNSGRDRERVASCRPEQGRQTERQPTASHV